MIKSNLRIESYGTVDELNSYIGWVRDLLTDTHNRNILAEIQDRLFTIGSSLACDPEKEPAMKIPDLLESDIVLLENEIDSMNAHLEPMRSFILPGGHATLSALHIARCVCRRAERCSVNLLDNQLFVEPLVIKYLNRLSDYLFVLARYTGWQLHIPEIPWKPRVK